MLLCLLVYIALFALLHICYSQITKPLYKVNYTNHRVSIYNLVHHQPGVQLRRSQTTEEALPKAH